MQQFILLRRSEKFLDCLGLPARAPAIAGPSADGDIDEQVNNLNGRQSRFEPEGEVCQDSCLIGNRRCKVAAVGVVRSSRGAQLPEEMRASKPEEVGTLIWLEWKAVRVGAYDDGTSAYVSTVTATIIDSKMAAIKDERVFQGSTPPHTATAYYEDGVYRGTYGNVGEEPIDELIVYLRSLPRVPL